MCVENEEMREFHLEKDGLMNQLIEDYTPADTASDQTEFSTFDFDLDYPEWEPRLVCDVKSDSDDELPVNENERSMQEKLADWAIKFNISRDALSALLCDLQTAIPGLPKDARTVLRTLKTVDTKTVAGGEYFYFGVEYWLSKLFERPPSSDVDKLHLHVNIDGIPLFNSCSTSVWPILGFVK